MSDVAESPSQSPIPLDENPTVTLARPTKKGKPTKLKKSVTKKPSTKPSHPATSELVLTAIKTLQEKNGSSLQAIKKFIASHYKLDTEKLAPFIKKYLKNAVASAKLIQTKGKGASGSFKLPAPAKPIAEKKKKLTKPNSPDKTPKPNKKDKKKKVKPATATKTSSDVKKQSSSKKVIKKSSASIKSAMPKQKSTKPSKVASKVKAPKTKKAPSVKKTNEMEKKATKTANAN